MSNPDEVDEGWLWSQAVEICREDKASAALSEAGSTDPRVVMRTSGQGCRVAWLPA
jgi:hypothetical protein